MSCIAPYTGASYTVCGCLSGSQYYDKYQEACMPLKTYNHVCRDSSECSDAYLNTGYCGYIPGGSKPVCTCIYNYYSIGTGQACQTTALVGAACTIADTWPQCEYNSYCSGGTCTCGTISYQNQNGSCLYKGYSGDPCTYGETNLQCWSNNCLSTGVCQ